MPSLLVVIFLVEVVVHVINLVGATVLNDLVGSMGCDKRDSRDKS